MKKEIQVKRRGKKRPTKNIRSQKRSLNFLQLDLKSNPNSYLSPAKQRKCSPNTILHVIKHAEISLS